MIESDGTGDENEEGIMDAMRRYFPMRIFVIVGPELFTVVAKIKVMAEFLTSCFPY